MTVVSSREFVSNQKRYFDLAVNDELFIKRGKNVFHLICTNVGNPIVEEDDDEYITKEELLSGINEDIHAFYANKCG
jgi:hypothetical protein